MLNDPARRRVFSREVAVHEYKAIPFLASVGGRDEKSARAAAAQLTAAINQHTVDGWELHELTSVSVMVNPGCLAALSGAKPSPMFIDQMIFRREVSAEARRAQTENAVTLLDKPDIFATAIGQVGRGEYEQVEKRGAFTRVRTRDGRDGWIRSEP